MADTLLRGYRQSHLRGVGCGAGDALGAVSSRRASNGGSAGAAEPDRPRDPAGDRGNRTDATRTAAGASRYVVGADLRVRRKVPARGDTGVLCRVEK